MNLKLIASLALLGVVSSPVLFAENAKGMRTHHHHHRHHHHDGVESRPVLHDYVESEALIAYNDAKSPVSSFDWTRRIHLGGLINVDARFGSRGPLGIVPVFKTSDDARALSVNNANLFVDADINPCVTAHLGIAYVDDSVNLFDIGINTLEEFSSISQGIRSDRSSVWANGQLSVDEAYITIADFAVTPFYLRAGKMYTPFGTYSDPYPISYSLPQVLSQTRGTGVEVGAVTSYGIYGSIMPFQGHLSSFNTSRDTLLVEDHHVADREHEGEFDVNIPYTAFNNYIAKLGYQTTYNCFDINVNASYIKDFRDVNYISDLQDLVRFTFTREEHNADPHRGNGFRLRDVSGGALHADVVYGPYTLIGNYVTAFESMVRDDHHGEGEGHALHNDEGDDHHHHHESNSRIWAGEVTGLYNSVVWGYNTTFGLSYQLAGQAEGILPERRYQGDISVELLHNLLLTLEYRHDIDFGGIHDAHHHRGRDGNDHDEHHDREQGTFCDGINGFTRDGHERNDICFGTNRNSNQLALRLTAVF